MIISLVNKYNAGLKENKVGSNVYIRKLQNQVKDLSLKVGTELNTKKDNMVGAVTINPKLLEKMQNDPKAFHIKWEEETKPIETTEVEANEEESETESESIGGKVGVNVGKTARKIAAAKTKNQLLAVIAEIKNDMQVVKDGMEKGWCDESEMDKVNSLMSMAQNRMGQVEDREATPEEENMFALESLM